MNGITIYAGSYFTGLNQGTASLLIAVAKGVVGPLLLVWMLPLLFGADALWLATPGSELIATVMMAGCILWWWRSGEDRHLGEQAEES